MVLVVVVVYGGVLVGVLEVVVSSLACCLDVARLHIAANKCFLKLRACCCVFPTLLHYGYDDGVSH